MQEQTSITFPVHRAENNSGSQRHLEANRDHFGRKCQDVYARLMRGERLTVLQCAIDGIASLPRRIKDLREQGVEIADEWAGNVKVYYAPTHVLAAHKDALEHMAAAERPEQDQAA